MKASDYDGRGYDPPYPTAEDMPAWAEELASQLRLLHSKVDQLLEQQPASEPGEFMTVKEAAEYIRMSPATLYKLKRLQVRRGRSVRFRRSALDAYFRPDGRKRAA